jgi:hypothetical protein
MIGLRRAVPLFFRVVFFAALLFAVFFRPAERGIFFMAGISSDQG